MEIIHNEANLNGHHEVGIVDTYPDLNYKQYQAVLVGKIAHQISGIDRADKPYPNNKHKNLTLQGCTDWAKPVCLN